nr:uncharacterized protein LOC112025000 isoform X2 [Quercus suber]POF09353.1 telomeric repeat-binding factor 1 [Quercus suber]
MDPDICRWISEFLMRSTAPDHVIKKVLQVLPVSGADSRFKKTVLLRTIRSEIADASVTETTLQTLELIEEMDRSEGVEIRDSLKAAYCAVAVECTVKYLLGSPDKHGEYFEAVKRVWRGRIGNLEKYGKTELVTDELTRWRDDLELALWEANTAKRLTKLNTRTEALRALRVFLGEAWALMGPSFLESAAALIEPSDLQNLSGDQMPANNAGGLAAATVEAAEPAAAAAVVAVVDSSNVGELGVEEEVGATHPEPTVNGEGSREMGVNDKPAGRGKEIHKGNVLPRCKHVAWHKRSKGGVRITEEVDTDASPSKYDSLPTPEVNMIREALKSSSLELQAVVNDPLPEALHLSETIIADMVKKDKIHEPSVENQSGKDIDALNPSVDKGVAAQTTDSGCGNQSCIPQGNATRPSLMERNGTAHTYEWEDSIDGSPGGMTNRAGRPHLPSPKRKIVSPLKKYEVTKFVRRRRLKRWSLLEEDTLRTGVQKYGKGNWKLILNSYRDIFDERTEVDLKDKWRNMTRY